MQFFNFCSWYKKLQRESNITIITPIKVYEEVWKKYENIFIIAANSIWAVLAEKEISKYWRNIVSMWYLEVVKKIELQMSPKEIIKKLNIKKLIEFIELNKFDIILLSCTHFPYIKDYLQSISKIDIIDLNDWIKRFL